MTRPIRLFLAVATASLTLPATADAAPTFDPIRFFTGHTEGRGRLKVLLSPHHETVVHGQGHVNADGALVLDQTVIEGDKPPMTREWVIHATGPGRYTGSLTDATGPVAIETDGDRLHIHFHMRGGIIADQRLVLDRGSQVAQNHMTFRKFGIAVAILDETIRREP